MWTCRDHGEQHEADLHQFEAVLIRLDGSREPFVVRRLTCVQCGRALHWKDEG